jgi:hypothetical protein
MQWPKDKGQKDKQRSTNMTQKTKDRATRTSLKTGVDLGCSGRVSFPSPYVAPIVLLLLQTGDKS